MNFIGTGNRSNLSDYVFFEYLNQFLLRLILIRLVEGDIGTNRLSFNIIRFSDDSGFRHHRM